MVFGMPSRLDKVMYGVLIVGMFAIGAGGAYLRIVQERIIATQNKRAEQITKLIETQQIRAKQITEIIETQKTRAEQIEVLKKEMIKLDGANEEFKKDVLNFKESQESQDKKLDAILEILRGRKR